MADNPFNGKLIGYARVSSAGQSLDVQLNALSRAGCAKVFAEKVTGTNRTGREQLELMLDFIREGDVVVVTKIDRLGRSVRDLHDVVDVIKRKCAALKVLDQSVDTTTPAGQAFFGMLSVFAEFETNLRKERQLDGIAAAKERGVYKGGTKTIDRIKVRAMLNEGKKPAHIARELRISRMSVYRIAEEAQTV
ncbi:recombinase family protein [Sinorhizobium meliloti]|uniref:recombinase family protein n=1 Tax=Rhizobium meliloti TaxID=382 RepID=UPI000FDBFEF8|nr:recombinase family protein [Sinorhizobium meliloti]RVI84187.1 recombinase family protein [Sinorhizobium meliloti]